MGRVEFAIWDQYRSHEMQKFAVPADVYERHFKEVQMAEQLGFHQYYIIEHQGSFVGQITSPTVFLSALAQHTSIIRLGAMIWQLPFHNPLRLAEDVATLDQLSRGRVEFGTGIGIHEHEFTRIGLNFADRQEMGEEALEIIKMAWTQEEVTYEGKFWRYDEALPAPRPYQQPYPPIWAAAHSHRALAFAARNNYHVAQNIDVDEDIAEKFHYYRKVWKECNHPGPMPRTFLMRNIFVAETDAKAREIAEPHVMNDFRLGREWIEKTRIGMGRSARGTGDENTPDIQARGRVFREVARSYDFSIENGIAIVGSPDTVVRKIKQQQEMMGGVDVYCGNFHVGDLSYEDVEKSLELFGKYVIPEFAK